MILLRAPEEASLKEVQCMVDRAKEAEASKQRLLIIPPGWTIVNIGDK